jgi:hypothetical protein
MVYRERVKHKREVALKRIALVADLNHDVRNSLCSILLNANCSDKQKRLERIQASVEHIEFVLKELVPTAGEEASSPRFFANARNHPRTAGRGSQAFGLS